MVSRKVPTVNLFEERENEERGLLCLTKMPSGPEPIFFSANMRPWFPRFAAVAARAGEGVSAVRHSYQTVNLPQRGRYSGLFRRRIVVLSDASSASKQMERARVISFVRIMNNEAFTWFENRAKEISDLGSAS